MTPREQSAMKPSSKTGLFATLRAGLGIKGTGAPRRALLAASLTAVLAVTALLCVSVAPALAAAPETPESKPVTAITATTATLNGVLNQGGPSEGGSYQFSYAPSTELVCAGGGVAPLSPALSVGAAAEAVAVPVTGLQPKTEYAVCLTAFSLFFNEPSGPSAAVTFETPPAPPSIDAESASGVSSTAATLEAQVNANNEETTYVFEYSKTEAAKKLTGTITTLAGEAPLSGFGDQTATVPALEKLLPGTTYFYRVVAENEQSKTEGKPVASPVTAFTTLSTPKTEPVTGITATTATFNGTLTPFTPAGEPRYSFDYNKGSEDCQRESATTPPEPPSTTTPTEPAGSTVSTEVTGLQPGATYSVCLVSSNPFGSEVDLTTVPQVSFTTLAGPPSIESESSSNITPEGATLEAQVNPNNQATTCSFEYSSEESKVTAHAGTIIPCSHPLGSGGKSVTGMAAVTGLELHKEYFYRALAENAAHENTSDPTIEHFETEATVAPSLQGEEATSITAETATLNGKVNPNGAQIKTCVFEYGTDTGYGHEAPCTNPDAAEVGAGRALVPVSAQLEGLRANVEYHWRLVTTSAAGTTTSVDQTFVEDTESATPPGSCPGQEHVRADTGSTNLPDCRAYELVTPPEKNGALIDSLFASGGPWGPLISNDGKSVMAPSIQCFAGAESCTGIREVEGNPYEFARTSQGWVTHALAPPASQFGNTSTFGGDPNTHNTLFAGSDPPEDHHDNFYVRTGTGPSVALGPLSENAENTSGANITNLEVGLAPTVETSDLSHLIFQTGTFEPGSFLWSLDGSPEERSKPYEYAGQNTGRPLAVAVTGPYGSTSLISQCESYIGSVTRAVAPFNALSETGRTVYFSVEGQSDPICQGLAAPPVDGVYARVDGERPDAHTVAISVATPASCKSTECKTSEGEPETAYFEGASRDGSRMFFTSTQQLTDHAVKGNGEEGNSGLDRCARAPGTGCNLYESVCAEPCGTPAEEPAAAARELVDVSEAEGGAEPAEGPQVQGVMAISPDGSHVYFVARGKLADNPGVMGAVAVEGQDNMYVYTVGEGLRFIATLPPSDEEELKGEFGPVWVQGNGVANVTPDGRFVVFASKGVLTADETRPENRAQIYRYDAQTGVMTRISIGEHGFNDNGDAGSPKAEPGIVDAFKGWYRTPVPGRADPTMSDDGQYVFFESPVALTPGALNEAKVTNIGSQLLAENVYEYHDGTVSLISDGKDTSPNSVAQGILSSTRLYGTDPSGHDVFFATDDQLTSQDTDTQRDYYDARICEEGDPCVAPPAHVEPCGEAACQGAPTSPPAAIAPGSASFNGPGNLTSPPPPAVLKPKPLTRAQKLAKALKACRTKHNKHKRTLCEKQARHQFGTAAKARKSTTDRRRTR